MKVEYFTSQQIEGQQPFSGGKNQPPSETPLAKRPPPTGEFGLPRQLDAEASPAVQEAAEIVDVAKLEAERRERRRAYKRAYMREYRKRPEAKAALQAYEQKPEVKDRRRSYFKSYNHDPIVKGRRNDRIRQRYQTDDVYREKKKARSRANYRQSHQARESLNEDQGNQG